MRDLKEPLFEVNFSFLVVLFCKTNISHLRFA